MKKRVILACLAVLTVLSMAACAAKGFDEDGNITVITRESGSGKKNRRYKRRTSVYKSAQRGPRGQMVYRKEGQKRIHFGS